MKQVSQCGIFYWCVLVILVLKKLWIWKHCGTWVFGLGTVVMLFPIQKVRGADCETFLPRPSAFQVRQLGLLDLWEPFLFPQTDLKCQLYWCVQMC